MNRKRIRTTAYDHSRGQFGDPSIVTTNGSWGSLDSADVDGDGDLDVLASASSRSGFVALYRNLDGQGSFGAAELVTTESLSVTDVITADLDRDGDLDAIAAAFDTSAGHLPKYRRHRHFADT